MCFLTVQADRPLCRFVPGPILQTSDIIFRHILVCLKVKVLIRACVADIPVKLYWLAVPLKGKESFLRRVWRVEASHPFAGVKAVVQSPA